MKSIRLSEYEKVPYARLGLSQVDELSRLCDQLGFGLFRFGRDELQASQYVGFVQGAEASIQIVPKIFNAPSANLSALVQMLSFTRRLPLRPTGSADLDQFDGQLLEIWMRHFALELNTVLRRNRRSEYIEEQGPLTFLRGKLLVKDLASGRYALGGRLPCRYEEFSPDHLLNRVLRFCNRLLLRQSRVGSTLSLLSENDVFLEDVDTTRAIRSSDIDRIHLNRLNRHFEPLLAMCRVLLTRATLDFRAGRIAQLAFVFDMNRLFEEFVFRFLRRYRDRISMGEGQRLRTVGEQCYLGQLFGEFRMNVDLVLEDTTGRRFLVDTKYKVLSRGSRHGALSQADFYQMFGYGRAGRLDCDGIILLYPRAAGRRPFSGSYEHEGLKLYVRQIDMRRVIDPESGRLRADAADEFSRALSVSAVSH